MGDQDERFFEFAYDRYKAADAAVESIYTICGITLGVLSAIGGGIAIGADGPLLRGAAGCGWAMGYGLSLVPSALTWAAAAVVLSLAIVPRKRYQNLKPITVWIARRKQIEATERATEAVFRELLDRLAEAEETSRSENETRRRRSKNAMVLAAVSLMFLAVATLVQFLSKL